MTESFSKKFSVLEVVGNSPVFSQTIFLWKIFWKNLLHQKSNKIKNNCVLNNRFPVFSKKFSIRIPYGKLQTLRDRLQQWSFPERSSTSNSYFKIFNEQIIQISSNTYQKINHCPDPYVYKRELWPKEFTTFCANKWHQCVCSMDKWCNTKSRDRWCSQISSSVVEVP